MYGYELLRNQWVILVLFAGLALVFYFILHYLDYYRPRKRKEGKTEEYETNYLGVWQAIPWSIKVTITIILVFAIVYSISMLIHPKSW